MKFENILNTLKKLDFEEAITYLVGAEEMTRNDPKPVTSTRFDSKAFKADRADLYNTYSKTSTTRRFIVA